MQPSEQKIYNLRVTLFAAPLRPLIKLLTSLGISADMVSYTGVLLMVVFIFVVKGHPVAGFWLLAARIFADILDGPMARDQKTDSDRGKFVDVLMDNLGFALYVFGIVYASLVSGITGSVYLFATELVILLMVIRFNFKHKSNWLFYASAGSYPYNFVYASYLLYVVYAFGGHNYLNSSAKIFSVLLVVKAIVDYWMIQKTRPRQS